MPFRDRVDAGRRLGERLAVTGEYPDAVVLGLPRGGVVVAAEVARALRAPLDIIVIRKLGVPYQPELAMGAVGEGGVRVLNPDVLAAAQVSEAELAEVERAQRDEVEQRVDRLRRGAPPVPVTGRTVLVVDDGVATGATARAACQVAREHGAARVVLAVPVIAAQAVADLRAVADEVVALEEPMWLGAIGEWYEDFRQTSDAEVIELLHAAATPE